MDEYTTRHLTIGKDKLPAISGIAREIAALTNYTYKAGLWLEDIHKSLMWSAGGKGVASTEYTAPSWSWAYLQMQPYSLYTDPYEVTKPISEILKVDVTTDGGDIYGHIPSGRLLIKGPSRSVDPWNRKQAQLHVDPEIIGTPPWGIGKSDTKGELRAR